MGKCDARCCVNAVYSSDRVLTCRKTCLSFVWVSWIQIYAAIAEAWDLDSDIKQ